MQLGLALTYARREFRDGLQGFWIFLGCIMIGVGAIAAVTSLTEGIEASLRDDGRAILGGDIQAELSLTQASDEQLAALGALGTVTVTSELRAMARSLDGPDYARVELRAVDNAYPLYGEFITTSGADLHQLLATEGGVAGAVMAPSLMARLDAEIGDVVSVGEGRFQIRDTIAVQPDQASGGFVLGAPMIIALNALEPTGLIAPGTLVEWRYRVRLPEGGDPDAALDQLRGDFPAAGWSLRPYSEAAPQLSQLIGQMSVYMVLVGLTALLVGGLGVSNAVRAFLERRLATIATLKCIGADSRFVFTLYLLQVFILAIVGVVVGMVIGGTLMVVGAELLSSLLPLEVRVGLYPDALGLSGLFGLLTALAFSAWPLARAQEVPAGGLFRALVMPVTGAPAWPYVVMTVGLFTALAALAILSAREVLVAVFFVAGTIGAVIAFRLAAAGIIWVARRLPRPRATGLRLAVGNLVRPGTPAPMVVLSAGLGLTVLVAIALIERNFAAQVETQIPDDAPDLFMIDVQPDQRDMLAAMAAASDGVSDLQQVPQMRGYITAVNGVPAAEALRDENFAWIIRGDRGVTYAAEPSLDRYDIVDGDWWPADYDGPPLVSIYADIAQAFQIGVGDELTVNILGRDVVAEVANLREIQFGSFRINFTLVFPPATLSGVPHSMIATVRAEPGADVAFEREVITSMPNVTTLLVRDALETITAIVTDIGWAIRVIAVVTLVVGVLVLGGAIAAGHQRRVYDAVVLKVLGATRPDIIRAFLIEYGLIGIVSAILAILIGSIAAWAVTVYVMNADWTFMIAPAVTTAALALGITLVLGLVGTWRALQLKPAPLLRNE